jgi:hypothetical protein
VLGYLKIEDKVTTYILKRSSFNHERDSKKSSDKEVVVEKRNCGEGRKSRKSHNESRNYS